MAYVDIDIETDKSKEISALDMEIFILAKMASKRQAEKPQQRFLPIEQVLSEFDLPNRRAW